MLQLTFLGTSAGIPTKHRNVTALAVELISTQQNQNQSGSKAKRPWVLIDCGEGTQHQLLHTKLSPNKLKAICITHVHGDHCYGLPGLLASMAMAGRKDELTLIAPRAIAKFLDAVTIATELYFDYPINFIAVEDYAIQASGKENNNNGGNNNDNNDDKNNDKNSDSDILTKRITLDISDHHQLDIDITAVSHRVASHAFSLTQTLNTQRLQTEKLIKVGVPASELWSTLNKGQDVTLDAQTAQLTGLTQLLAKDYVESLTEITKIVVGGDNDTPNLLSHAIKGSSLLVHEATYTQAVADTINARPDSHDPMHTTAKSIASFAEAAQVPNLILTHFSARYQPFDKPSSKMTNMSDIRLEIEQYYQGEFWLAQDFAKYMVNGKEVTEVINADD